MFWSSLFLLFCSLYGDFDDSLVFWSFWVFLFSYCRERGGERGIGRSHEVEKTLTDSGFGAERRSFDALFSFLFFLYFVGLLKNDME